MEGEAESITAFRRGHPRTARPATRTSTHAYSSTRRGALVPRHAFYSGTNTQPGHSPTHTTGLRTTILRHTEALRAYRVVVMICVLHVSNALRPVTTRCGNTNLSPPFCHQDRQSIIPRGREFRARPMIQVHVAIAIRQPQTFHEKLSRSRPPSPSRLDTKWYKLDVVR